MFIKFESKVSLVKGTIIVELSTIVPSGEDNLMHDLYIAPGKSICGERLYRNWGRKNERENRIQTIVFEFEELEEIEQSILQEAEKIKEEFLSVYTKNANTLKKIPEFAMELNRKLAELSVN